MLDLFVYHPLATLGVIFTFYLTLLVIYRLLLHPLASYPGPKLAALSVWYEFYYDGICQGRYTFEIQRMHEKYGPIVRIGPNELHVNDPAFIEELYAGSGKKRDKGPNFGLQFGIPDSLFGTPSHDLHRLRRGALSPFFSKASVTKLEPIIHRAIDKLTAQLQRRAKFSNPTTISMALSCMTTDIVTEYAFAKSYNFLDSPTFEPNFHRVVIAGGGMGHWTRQFPFLNTLMNKLPHWIMMCINPDAAVYIRFQEDMRRQIREVQARLALRGAKQDPNSDSSRTIFQELLTGTLPDEEKQVERLWQEGQLVVAAGTETTAWTLSVAIFYLLDNPHIMEKLEHELIQAIPDMNQRVSWNYLEQLPYLSAVICESLRLSYGVSSRLQRINPDGPLHYRACVPRNGDEGKAKWVEYQIPQGTPVGMTSFLIHAHPDLFPNPYTFQPERWLDECGKRHHHLDKYLLSFSRGSRQCLGINLAYAELYMGLGLLIRRFGSRMQLFETTKEDVEFHHDRFVPTPKDGTKGVRVLVLPEIE